MARNDTEQNCSAACPFAGVIVELGDKIPGKPDNFRACLNDCILKRVNDMSAGVDLKEDKNFSKESPLLISRCSLFEIIGGQNFVDLREANRCRMGSIDGNFCTRVYSAKGDGFDQINDRYAESYWRICNNTDCQRLTPVGMVLKR